VRASARIHLLESREDPSELFICIIASVCVAVWSVSNSLTRCNHGPIGDGVRGDTPTPWDGAFPADSRRIVCCSVSPPRRRWAGYSVEAGEDRTALWGEGLQLFKAYPLFGVGFGAMPDHAGQTAHNSLVVCAAELGIVGLYFWALFLFPTVRDTLEIATPTKVGEGVPIVLEVTPYPNTIGTIETVDREEICRLGWLILLSLTGFLVAAWFLSRAFVVTVFLLGGIVEVVFQMALRRGMVAPRLPAGRVMRNSAGLAIALILTMYVMLRVVNVMH